MFLKLRVKVYEQVRTIFLKGHLIEEVVQVTDPRNLNILWQIYTQLYPYKQYSLA